MDAGAGGEDDSGAVAQYPGVEGVLGAGVDAEEEDNAGDAGAVAE